MTNKEITKKNVRRVKNLLEEVKELTPEKFQTILDSLARFHNYSFYNQIILCFAGCSQVAGYKKWKELGRTVKKGEKGVWILAPWFKKVKAEEGNGKGRLDSGLQTPGNSKGWLCHQ